MLRGAGPGGKNLEFTTKRRFISDDRFTIVQRMPKLKSFVKRDAETFPRVDVNGVPYWEDVEIVMKNISATPAISQAEQFGMATPGPLDDDPDLLNSTILSDRPDVSGEGGLSGTKVSLGLLAGHRVATRFASAQTDNEKPESTDESGRVRVARASTSGEEGGARNNGQAQAARVSGQAHGEAQATRMAEVEAELSAAEVECAKAAATRNELRRRLALAGKDLAAADAERRELSRLDMEASEMHHEAQMALAKLGQEGRAIQRAERAAKRRYQMADEQVKTSGVDGFPNETAGWERAVVNEEGTPTGEWVPCTIVRRDVPVPAPEQQTQLDPQQDGGATVDEARAEESKAASEVSKASSTVGDEEESSAFTEVSFSEEPVDIAFVVAEAFDAFEESEDAEGHEGTADSTNSVVETRVPMSAIRRIADHCSLEEALDDEAEERADLA